MPSIAPIEQADLSKQNISPPDIDPDQFIVELARELDHCRPRRASFTIPARLKQFMRFFQECYEYFEETNKTQVATSQTSEWLMDNFYVIEQAVRQVEQDLPADYYQRLPKTRDGWTRIHLVAIANARREEARLEMEQLRHFLRVFQDTTPLDTGELWALPLMLRLTVLDSLAEALAAVTKLRWDSIPSPKLSVASYPSPDLQSNPDLIVANSILNLRLLATQDWKIFFESTSVLEKNLRRDPAELYDRMDFETRNHYRGVIEDLSAGSSLGEAGIAEQAIELAQSGTSARAGHVGYYLIDRGRDALETRIKFRPRFSQALVRIIQTNATAFYLGSIALLTFTLFLLIVLYTASAGGTLLHMIAAGVLSLLPISSVAIDLLNGLVISLIPPRTLPKLNFENGVPEECRTMVVIPSLLASERDAPFLLSQI
jgi:cyclic beta-1,2-glucan synthetase